MSTWKIDQAHSEVKFKVKHLLVTTVTGGFNNFDAVIESENDDFSGANIRFEADINSINTKNEQRDAHLKSADFFDAENHPKMTFISKSFTKIKGNKFSLNGDLTIRGITKEVTLEAEYNGMSKGFDSIDVTGFDITGKLNRFDFNLHWNAMTEAGGVVVSSEVKLEIFAEMKRAVEVNKAA